MPRRVRFPLFCAYSPLKHFIIFRFLVLVIFSFVITALSHFSSLIIPEKLATSISFIKRHMFAAPFDHVFKSMEGTPTTEMLDIPYRGQERVFIKANGKDRVSVFFTINFKDPDDIIIGKVFLQVRLLLFQFNSVETF